MIPTKYKFYISKNDGDKVEVRPHYKELNKKYAKESGQEFFRISLDGKINLFGTDYEIVSQSNIEDQLVFIIDKYNSTSKKWVEYYRGEFSKTDCKFDHDKKKCELKTTAVDGYTEVMNKYENTYDLIKLAPEISKINLHKQCHHIPDPLTLILRLGYWETLPFTSPSEAHLPSTRHPAPTCPDSLGTVFHDTTSSSSVYRKSSR